MKIYHLHLHFSFFPLSPLHSSTVLLSGIFPFPSTWITRSKSLAIDLREITFSSKAYPSLSSSLSHLYIQLFRLDFPVYRSFLLHSSYPMHPFHYRLHYFRLEGHTMSSFPNRVIALLCVHTRYCFTFASIFGCSLHCHYPHKLIHTFNTFYMHSLLVTRAKQLTVSR